MAASRQQKSVSKNKAVDFNALEESSDSDGETEPARIFHRRISTNKDIKTA
ncbi:diacylglycerol kinase delta isoform X9, partial [Biomphalaria glabrata]